MTATIAFHVAAVYFSADVGIPWLAGRVHDWILPMLHHPSKQSYFEFMFNHLLVFSLVTGSIAGVAGGLSSCGRRRDIPLLIWAVPTLILLYKVVVFRGSVLESHTAAAYHEYFARNFSIPEYTDYRSLFDVAVRSSDLRRGIEQLRFSAPCYTGIAYSLSSFCLHVVSKLVKLRMLMDSQPT